MTWASELLKKRISPRDAWEEVPNEDVKDEANKEYLLKDGYLFSAVLRENKKIEKELAKRQRELGTPNSSLGTYRKIEQARCFRELVEEAQKHKEV